MFSNYIYNHLFIFLVITYRTIKVPKRSVCAMAIKAKIIKFMLLNSNQLLRVKSLKKFCAFQSSGKLNFVYFHSRSHTNTKVPLMGKKRRARNCFSPLLMTFEWRRISIITAQYSAAPPLPLASSFFCKWQCANISLWKTRSRMEPKRVLFCQMKIGFEAEVSINFLHPFSARSSHS
jgi:hypothetical protein